MTLGRLQGGTHHDERLAGRKAIVTGAAQGLGRAFALRLASAGAGVAVCDTDATVFDVARDIGSMGRRSSAMLVDVSQADDVRTFVDLAAETLGGLDLVVNNAGIVRVMPPLSQSWQEAVEDFDEVIGVNLRGTFLVGRAAMPHLIRHGGDIVNISTDHMHNCGYPVAIDHEAGSVCVGARDRRPLGGGPDLDAYDASKWAIAGLTLAWARALRGSRVRVNTLGMGATDTPMYRRYLNGAPPASGVLTADGVADVLVELIAEGPDGRTGDDVQLWAGHRCVLPPVSVSHEMVVAR